MELKRFDPPTQQRAQEKVEWELEYGFVYKFLLGGFLLLLGMGFVWLGASTFLRDQSSGSLMGSLFLILLGLGLFGAPVFHLFRARLEKTSTRLRYRGVLGVREVPLAMLKSFRVLPKNYVVLQLKEGGKKLQIPKGFQGIEKLLEWAEKNLEDEEKLEGAAEDAEAIAALAHLKPGVLSDTQKLEAYARIKKRFGLLQGGVYGLLGWGWLAPELEYRWLVLLLSAAPILIFGFMYFHRGVIRLDGAQKTGAPKAALPLLGAFVVLGFRAMADFSLLEYRFAFVNGAAIALLLGSVMYALAPDVRKRIGALVLYTLVSFAYGYGVTVEANCLLDQAKPESFIVEVLDKHATSGRHSSYYFKVVPWGPRQQPNDVPVEREFYERLVPGQKVLISLYTGALGAGWFTVSR